MEVQRKRPKVKRKKARPKSTDDDEFVEIQSEGQTNKDLEQKAITKVTADDIENLLPELPEVKQEDASVTAAAKEDVKNDETIMTPLGEVKHDETTVTTENIQIELAKQQDETTATITPEITPLVQSTSPILEAAIIADIRPQDETVSSKPEMTETKLKLTTPTVTGDVDMKDEVLERTEEQVVVAKLEVSESVEVVTNPAMTELPSTIAYPRLDSLIAVGTTDVDDTLPYTEEELAALYPNPQLDSNEQYIDQFIKDSQQDNHELYHLLIAYLKQRQSIVVLQCKVEDLNKSYERKKTELWKTESRTITTQGKCSDNSEVSHSHTYNMALFNRNSLNNIKTILQSMRKLLEEELCLKLYSTQLAKLHIDYYLYQMCIAIPSLRDMTADSPVACIVNEGMSSPDIVKLRNCISVLFMFERRPIDDVQFKTDCRQWLDMLLGVLLRVASLQDHQFILNHLLRCPPGVAEWGTKYLQMISPLAMNDYSTQFAGSYDIQEGMGQGLHRDWGGPILDHFVTMLATLTLPIKERDKFLSMLGVASTGAISRQKSTPWTFIEEDLEEEENEDHHLLLLKESDFTEFFDQFPLNDVFQYILHITDNDYYQVELTSSYSMLRLISFSTCVIRLLGTAFSTLRLQRYKEFNKRIGRCIRLIVQFVADHWLAYKSYQVEQLGLQMNQFPYSVLANEPRYTLNRLQLEVDYFILRATRWIMMGHKLGAWQFMADMPYSVISIAMVWHIFLMLYTNTTDSSQDQVCDINLTKQRLKDPAVREQFVDRMMRNLTSETVFLLTTFVNMASACAGNSAEEVEFINKVASEIFKCTQLVEFARDAYSDTGCMLLDSIAIIHPTVISTLLQKTRDNIGGAGENCLMVFKRLPLHLWTPSQDDMEIIRDWLISFPLSSSETTLAMLILSNMNWGTRNVAKLALDYSLHKKVALLLVEAHARHLPTHPGGVEFGSGLNPDLSLTKYVTSLGTGMKEDQSNFSQWTWEVSLMLKLHPMQQPNPILQPMGLPEAAPAAAPPSAKSLQSYSSWTPGSSAMVASLPSLAQPEFIEVQNAVERKGLLASYLAFCLSNIGTDTDAFMEFGVPLLYELVEQGYILPAIRVLANITPRFFGQEKVLQRQQKFMDILFKIANADFRNVSLTEKVTNNYPPPVYLRNLLALIQTQIHKATAPGHSISEAVLNFWVTLCVSYPNWYRERCLLYLLDGLSQVAFKFPKWQMIIWEVLLVSYLEIQQTQPQKSGLLSTLWYLWGQEGELPSLFRLVPLKEFPYLAYDALSAEQMYEQNEGYWTALLRQLKSNHKATVDAALKRALTEMKKPGGSFLCNHFCIYRWASFASQLPPSHPILPLVWQRFFLLYLQRPILESRLAESDSYGKRLMEYYGDVKTLKCSLSQATSYHQKQSQAEDLDESPDKEHHRDLAKVYQTFLRWLEEPMLHESTLHLPSLPPQYDTERLQQLFNYDNAQPWLDLVPMWRIEKETLEFVSDWVKVAAFQKQKPFVTHNKVLNPDTAGTRIIKRLHKKVSGVKPPPLVLASNPLPVINEQIYASRELLVATVARDIAVVTQEARNFSVKTSAVTLLDEEYIELAPKLYKNEARQFHVNVPCRKRFNRNHVCAGPAILVFRFEEQVAVTHCQKSAEQNRKEHKETVTALRSFVSHDLCVIVVKFEHIINELIRLANQQLSKQAADAAIGLFYEMTKYISVESKHYGPSSQFFTSIIEILGQEFIQRDPLQTRVILETMISSPHLCGLLAPLFKPNLSPDMFLEMYNTTIELAVKEGPTIAFQLFTKFNIQEFLDTAGSSSKEQEELLAAVYQGLLMCGSGTDSGADVLLEIFRRHFCDVLRFKFPRCYHLSVKAVLTGTDNGGISAACWYDLLKCIKNSNENTDNSSGCIQTNLTLKQLQETVSWFGTHFAEQRKKKPSLYSSYKNYIVTMADFHKFLIQAICTRLSSMVEVHSTSVDEAISVCWQSLLHLYQPWITTITDPNRPDVKFHPWLDYEASCAEHFVDSFVKCAITMQANLKTPNYSNSPVALVWSYYCEYLSTATADYVISVYHDKFVKLPWEEFLPDLASIEHMIKLKLKDYHPSSFLFLGEISSSIDWLGVVQLYNNTEPESDKITTLAPLHDLLLQLFVMLSNECGKVSNSTDILHVLHKAHNFYWHYLDSKSFANVTEWLKVYSESSLVLFSGSSLSASLRLLRVAAGFPSKEDLPLHPESSDKQKSYIGLLVELVSKCSYLPNIEQHQYSEIVSHMFQLLVDTAASDDSESGQQHVIKLLEDVFNLLNICNHSNNSVNGFINIIHSVYDVLPKVHLISLLSITAACRAIAAIPTMVDIIEKSIEAYFTSLTKPVDIASGAAPDTNGYGWYNVVGSMIIPDTIMAKFRGDCVIKCACLTLHAIMLQTLPTCQNFAQERHMLAMVMDWCMQIKLEAAHEYKMFLLWEKVMGLLLRQCRYQGGSSDLVNSFSNLVQMLVKFGEDKTSEGFLGAIGLGKKSQYTIKFRLIARSLAAFISVQMPMDASHTTQLRLTPIAPGHIKGQKGGISPTKQAEQIHTSLESLQNNKQYLMLKEHIFSACLFVNESKKTLMDMNDIFIHLVASLYSEYRSLDLIRVQIA